MTELVAAVVLMAALFGAFGLLRLGGRGSACDTCPGGCLTCPAPGHEHEVEVRGE